jgi:methylmalonyl-CoA mutase cobalamin-binding subunit
VIDKYVPQLQFLDVLLGDEPALEPHARVYQRLLAMDQEEATELVEDYLDERPIEQVYDEILIPALSLAEQDGHKGRLDPERQAYVRQAMRDIVEDVRERYRLNAERDAAEQVRQAAEETVKAAKTGARPLDGTGDATPATGSPGAGAARVPVTPRGNGNGNVSVAADTPQGTGAAAFERPTLPAGCVVNVVLLPAHDDADEIAALMLSHLLELRGFCSFPVAVERLASEMVEAVEKRQAHVICVSAMPPAAVTHSRYLCKRLHAKYPDMDMVVGLWTARGDLKKAKERITCAQAVQVTTTLVDALEQIQQKAQPIIVKEAATGEIPAPGHP